LSEVKQLIGAHFPGYFHTWYDSVLALLKEEAPLWGSEGQDPFKLRPDLRVFRGLGTTAADVEDYLDRVADWIQPSWGTAPPREPLAPTAIHEALDHLDAVIRLSVETRYRPGRGVASLGELALACASRQDFEGRVSALVDALAHIYVPDHDPSRRNVGPTLDALERYLVKKADPAVADVIENAVGDLRAVADVRHAKEHGDAAFRAPKAYVRLGVPWPVMDWPAAWDTVGGAVVAALRVLREELRRAS